MASDGFNGVLAARRMKSTRRRHQRRNQPLVSLDHPGKERTHQEVPIRFQPSATSAPSDSKSASAACGCAMMTTSNPEGIISACRRMASRSLRLTRFRTTAFPTFRLTVRPTRVRSAPLGTNNIMILRHRIRFPVRCTRWISTDLRNRCWRGSPRRNSSAALAGNRGNQLFPTLGSATSNDVATACGLHACTESVGALALDLAWLVCAFHLNLRGRAFDHGTW